MHTKAIRITTALLIAMLVPTGQASAQLLNQPSDTIVRNQVDPKRFAGQPAVMLLDEVVNHVEPSGTWKAEVRQVVQVISATAARGFSERAFNWDPSHQRLTIKWVRVLRLNSEVISEKVAQEQDSDVGAQLSNPVYQARRQKRISLANVGENTIVDVAYTLEQTEPYRPGDFLFNWTFASRAPLLQSRFTVDVPESFTPRISERNLTFKRKEETTAGRHIYEWALGEIPSYTPERFEPDSNGITMSVMVSAPDTWTHVARWYDSLADSRYTLSEAAAYRIDSLVHAAGARTRLDTIRAVHRWVTQDFRYVSVALGMGGYQPRSADEMLSTGFGDCKDKATLFVASLRRYGIPAYPVLLSSSGSARKSSPGVHQFDHAIAAVGDGTSRSYTDLTVDTYPFGTIPDRYSGSFALVVHSNRPPEEIQLPIAPVDDSRSVMRVRLTLDTTGAVTGRVEQEATGLPAATFRALFGQPLDSARRATLGKGLANSIIPSAAADSLVGFDGRDMTAHPAISFTINSQLQLRSVGDLKIVTLPRVIRGNAAGYATIAKELNDAPPRKTPIDAGKILGHLVTVTDFELTLPPGWTAELPKSLTASSFFGSYDSQWTQSGNKVRLVRTIKGARGIVPSQRIVEVATWFRTTGTDDNEFLTLRPPQ